MEETNTQTPVVSATPALMDQVPFDKHMANFTDLTERRETLKRSLKEKANENLMWLRDQGFNQGELIVVRKKSEPSSDEDVNTIAKSGREVEWLAGITRYPSGMNSILLKRFPELRNFVEAVITENERRNGLGEVDEEATKTKRDEYAARIKAAADIEIELSEVDGRIASIKEFIDVADKVSNIGSRRSPKTKD